MALQAILDLVSHLGVLWQRTSFMARMVVVALRMASFERLQHLTLCLEVLERLRALLVAFTVPTATHVANLRVLHNFALLLMAFLVVVIMIFVTVQHVLYLGALVMAHEVHTATPVTCHRFVHRSALLGKLDERTSACVMASAIAWFACSVALQDILDLARHLGILWQGASFMARMVVVAFLMASFERLQHLALCLEVLEWVRALLVAFMVHPAIHVANLGVLHHFAHLLMAVFSVVMVLKVVQQVAKLLRCVMDVVPNTMTTRGMADELRDAKCYSKTNEELDSGHHCWSRTWNKTSHREY